MAAFGWGFDHNGIATLRDGRLVRYTAKDGLPNDDTTQIFEDREAISG